MAEIGGTGLINGSVIVVAVADPFQESLRQHKPPNGRAGSTFHSLRTSASKPLRRQALEALAQK